MDFFKTPHIQIRFLGKNQYSNMNFWCFLVTPDKRELKDILAGRGKVETAEGIGMGGETAMVERGDCGKCIVAKSVKISTDQFFDLKN